MEKKLVIVTSVIHSEWEGCFYAPEPYVREANLWQANFNVVRVIAPLIEKRPEKHDVTYTRDDVDLKKVPKLGGHTLLSKIRTIISLPMIFLKILSYVHGFNHLHVRLPGNIGFFGLLLCPMLSMRKTAKYAGQWDDYPSQPLSVKLQKILVSKPWWFRNGKVLVYGDWPGMPQHLVNFFTASYWEREISEAGFFSDRKELLPWKKIHLAFVARLTPNKGCDIALSALKHLIEAGIDAQLHVVGDGSELSRLKALSESLGVTDHATFYGNQSKETVIKVFQKAHFVLSLSQTEAWSKVVVEGMVWGAIPVATPISVLPQTLDYGKRGKLVSRDSNSVAKAIIEYVQNPTSYKDAVRRAHSWAKQFTMEAFESAISRLT